ncbi:ribosome biogenesis GTPase YqeH [Pseudothermotoga sp. U03pept]|uniref:ribosome biogenesis GTPase YqeH n=1 Tax=Pseudothermotoga sp. U03pept TaxID=3447012 RepID=UPI003F1220D9
MTVKCKGCGAQIQHDDEKKPGFIPLEVFTRRKEQGEEILCQRCFRARHYGKLEPVIISKSFTNSLLKIVKDFEVIVWVVDITDFEGSHEPVLSEILKDSRKILVVNKIDLLPRAVTIQEIENWSLQRVQDERIEGIYLTSTLRKYGIRRLATRLSDFNRILFVGVTNVGKSSLVHALTGADISITPFPGTTLGLISAKMNKTVIYDSPGILTKHRVIDLLPPNCQKQIVAEKHLSRKTFKPQRDTVIFLGGMCKLQIIFSTELAPIFQIFASEGVKFHLTNSEKADDLWKRQYGRLLVPPCKPKEPSFESLKWSEREFELTAGEELAIAGLGWLSVRRGPVKIRAAVPDQIIVQKRTALINPYRGGMADE